MAPPLQERLNLKDFSVGAGSLRLGLDIAHAMPFDLPAPGNTSWQIQVCLQRGSTIWTQHTKLKEPAVLPWMPHRQTHIGQSKLMLVINVCSVLRYKTLSSHQVRQQKILLFSETRPSLPTRSAKVNIIQFRFHIKEETYVERTGKKPYVCLRNRLLCSHLHLYPICSN